MKRRILMVSAMILLFGSQVQIYAQKKVEPNHKRPGMATVVDHKPARPMNGKAISQGEIARLQDFYWKKYRVKLTKKEAERILIEDMKNKGPREFARHTPPPPKKGHRPEPRGPQRPHKK